MYVYNVCRCPQVMDTSKSLFQALKPPNHHLRPTEPSNSVPTTKRPRPVMRLMDPVLGSVCLVPFGAFGMNSFLGGLG